MKKFYLFFILLVAAILGGTAAFFYVWNKPKKSIAKIVADYSIATDSLAGEFLRDTALADNKYTGKVVVLNGVIDEIEIGMAGHVNFIFVQDSFEIQCTLDSLASAQANTYKVNDSVRLKGKYVGYLIDDIFGLQVKLNNCITQ